MEVYFWVGVPAAFPLNRSGERERKTAEKGTGEYIHLVGQTEIVT